MVDEAGVKIIEAPKPKFQHLSEECGHHCGAKETAPNVLMVRHCDCSECHIDGLMPEDKLIRKN